MITINVLCLKLVLQVNYIQGDTRVEHLLHSEHKTCHCSTDNDNLCFVVSFSHQFAL